jgi:hypothetical protein
MWKCIHVLEPFDKRHLSEDTMITNQPNIHQTGLYKLSGSSFTFSSCFGITVHHTSSYIQNICTHFMYETEFVFGLDRIFLHIFFCYISRVHSVPGFLSHVSSRCNSHPKMRIMSTQRNALNWILTHKPSTDSRFVNILSYDQWIGIQWEF